LQHVLFPWFNYQCQHCPTLIRTEAGKTDTERERFHTISEVARLLEVSDQSIRRWIKAGELKAYKPKKEYRIAESDLQEFLEGRAVPLVQAPLPEPSLFNGLEEERREAIDVVMDAARRQAEQDRQAAARALESERPQAYFKRHENAVVHRLLDYPADELAGALIEMAQRILRLEEAQASAKAPLSLENFPAEQVAAFLAENERDKEWMQQELEKLTPGEIKEMILANPSLRRIRDAYAESEKRRAQNQSEVV
jgi:excisionase family DNA binding protein